jgi:hypothetical protein
VDKKLEFLYLLLDRWLHLLEEEGEVCFLIQTPFGWLFVLDVVVYVQEPTKHC